MRSDDIKWNWWYMMRSNENDEINRDWMRQMKMDEIDEKNENKWKGWELNRNVEIKH